MFRNIVWDVDGTLFNTYPAIAKAFQAAMNDFGKEASLDWVGAVLWPANRVEYDHNLSRLHASMEKEGT